MLSTSPGPLHIHIPQRNIHDTDTPRSTSVNKHSVSVNFWSSPLSHTYLYTTWTYSQPHILPHCYLSSDSGLSDLMICIFTNIHRRIYALIPPCFMHAGLRRHHDPCHIILKSSDCTGNSVCMKEYMLNSCWKWAGWAGDDREGSRNRWGMPSRNKVSLGENIWYLMYPRGAVKSWALLAVPMASSNHRKPHITSPEGAPATRSTGTRVHKCRAVCVWNSVSSLWGSSHKRPYRKGCALGQW